MDVVNRLDWFRRSDRPDAEIFDGTVTAVKFREGFGLHTLNARATRAFSLQTERSPSVVLHCFLEGATNAWLANKPMNLGRHQETPVRFVLTSTSEALSFERRSDPGEYVRKISIQMSQEWLDESGLSLPPYLDCDEAVHQRLEWAASGSEITAMEQLVARSSFADPLARLSAEAMTLELVAGAFHKLNNISNLPQLTGREEQQLGRIEEFVRQPGPLPDLSTIAKACGLSHSSLRRLVQKTYGCSPLAYVREQRLLQAHMALENEGVSVSQAASLAGFAHPENFATAFRKKFGHRPSDSIYATRNLEGA
ncbi:MAG: helix-turn-helix transcriptional regulator [Shimia sp.]|nr:helix-turn-helix transcriptional regulator [Shimia sp.]